MWVGDDLIDTAIFFRERSNEQSEIAAGLFARLFVVQTPGLPFGTDVGF